MQLVLLASKFFILTLGLQNGGICFTLGDRGSARLSGCKLVDTCGQLLEFSLELFQIAFVLELLVQSCDFSQSLGDLFISLLDQTLIVGLVFFNDGEHEFLLLESHLFLLDFIQDALDLVFKLLLRTLIEVFHQRRILGVQSIVGVLHD